MNRRRRVMVGSMAAVTILLAGCSKANKQLQSLPAEANPPPPGRIAPTLDSTTTVALTVPTTAATTTTTIPPAIGPAGNLNISRILSSGITGEDVKAVEQRLSDLKFSTGKIDGTFDSRTSQAVLSFQKQTGLPRTGRVDPATATRMNSAGYGVPMVSDGNPDRVEVDISRQILQIWRGGQLFRVLGVSTGTGKHYCDTNEAGQKVCGVAVTPTGRFTFSRRIAGPRKSDLGVLFDPVYFSGGYAVHGSPSVPASPASHGCVRIPMWESKSFFNDVAIGTQMIVIKNGAPPVPTLAAPIVTAPPTTATTIPPVTMTIFPTTTTTRPLLTTTLPTLPTTTTTRPTSTTRGLFG